MNKINERVWHPVFLWGTIIMPPNKNKTLVKFDFDEVIYFTGMGYSTYKKSNGDNVVYLPSDELYSNQIPDNELSEKDQLMRLALNATIK